MEQQNLEITKDTCAISQTQMKDRAFSRFFFSSLIALLVVIATLCSTTFAWYSASLSSSTTLTAACYDISVSVENSGVALTPDEDGSYVLTAGGRYTVTLAKSPFATAEKGYGEIVLSGMSLFTEQINGGSIVFTLEPSTNAIAFFIPHIGTGTASNKIANGDTVILNS